MSKAPRHLPVGLGLFGSFALALAALSARSQTPPAATYTAPPAPPSAAPSPTGLASGSAQAAKPTSLLRGADIPAEASDAPKDKKDWDPAKVVFPNSGASGACVFKLLREWLRIECETRIGGALLAGETADVKVWAWGDPFAALDTSPAARLERPVPSTVIVLPLRRGESKVFDVSTIDSGWDWVGPSAAERISVAWRDGSDDPVLLVGRGP